MIIIKFDLEASIMLYRETPKAFPLKSETQYEYLLFPLLFNIFLELLDKAIRWYKYIRGIRVTKEYIKSKFL